MQTDDLLLRTDADDLVRGRPLLLRLHHGVVHGGELGLVDLDLVAVLLARLGLGQTNGADLGVREDDARDVLVDEVGIVLTSEQAVRQTAAGGDSNGSKLVATVANVADGIDVLEGGVLEVVGDNVVLVVELDAEVLDVEVFDLGVTTSREKDGFNLNGALLLGLVLLVGDALHTVANVLHLGDRGSLVQVDALALVLLCHSILNHRVECSQKLVATDEEMCLGAQGVQHTSHLNADVSCTARGNAFRLLLKVEEAIAVDGEFLSGNFRLLGSATGGNEDVLCLDTLGASVLKRNLDLVLGNELGSPPDVLDLVLVKVPLVDAVQTLDVGVALVLEVRPVKLGLLLDLEPICLSVLECLCDRGSVPCDLLGTQPTLTQVPP